MERLIALVRKEDPKHFADRVFVNFISDWTCLLSEPEATRVVPIEGHDWKAIEQLTGFPDAGTLLCALLSGPFENESYTPYVAPPSPQEIRRGEIEEAFATAEGRRRYLQELGRKPPKFTDRAEWELVIEAAARAALHESPIDCFDAVAAILTPNSLDEASGPLRAERVLSTIAEELSANPRPVDKRWAAALMEWGQHPQLVEASSKLLGVMMSCPGA